jgi:outer membrane protein TolC
MPPTFRPKAARMRSVALTFAAVSVFATTAGAQPAVEAPKVTFEEAITTALEKNPGIAEAAQAILRAQAFLIEAQTVHRPTVSSQLTTNILDRERGFNGLVTQPQVQSLLVTTASYPVLAASRWAARTQAEDQVGVARLNASEVRRQIAVATAQAYLAVIAAQRQIEVNLRARENAQAHVDDARARLEAGAGSKLNELRAAQELASDEVLLEAARLAAERAQEALGVLLAADGPIDAAAEPVFAVPAVVTEDAALADRTDIRLFSAQFRAADRVHRDSWKDWVPNATAAFEPALLAPSGLFQPSRTWRGYVAFSIPIVDAGSRRATARDRAALRETARVQLTDLELHARSEVRTARASVDSTERALAHARLAAQHAADVLNITTLAFRAGGTTNLELIDAQRRARDADILAEIAGDRLRQSHLDLLVALGRFPQ